MNSTAWTKICILIVVAISLASFTSMLLDPRLGRADDESRRVTHPAGFSIIAPRGWTSANSTETSGPRAESMAITDPKGVGIDTSITVSRVPSGFPSVVDTLPDAYNLTFQGQPARAVAHERRKSWIWTMRFDRAEDGGHYEIEVIARLPQDLEHGPLRPFLDSFKPSTKPAPTTTPAMSQPAISPLAH